MWNLKLSLFRLKNCKLNNIPLKIEESREIYENLDNNLKNVLAEIKDIANSLSLAKSNATTLLNMPSADWQPIPQRVETVQIPNKWELPYLIKDASYINSISYTPNGRFLVSGGSDCSVKVWDMKTGRNVNTFKGHSDRVYSVSCSYDGKYIASGGGDNSQNITNRQYWAIGLYVYDISKFLFRVFKSGLMDFWTLTSTI